MKSSGATFGSSSQSSGAETGAPGFGRGQSLQQAAHEKLAALVGECREEAVHELERLALLVGWPDQRRRF